MPAEIVLFEIDAEQRAFFEILVADGRREIGPARLFRVGWRVQRIEADVAESAGHADQVGRFHRGRVGLVLIDVPGDAVKLRIGKLAQANDA
jgi:hypothetical protein